MIQFGYLFQIPVALLLMSLLYCIGTTMANIRKLIVVAIKTPLMPMFMYFARNIAKGMFITITITVRYN